jgi:hypothetical protein
MSERTEATVKLTEDWIWITGTTRQYRVSRRDDEYGDRTVVEYNLNEPAEKYYTHGTDDELIADYKHLIWEHDFDTEGDDEEWMMTLNKSETKVMERLERNERDGSDRVTVETADGRRMMNAARSLAKKGILEFVSGQNFILPGYNQKTGNYRPGYCAHGRVVRYRRAKTVK